VNNDKFQELLLSPDKIQPGDIEQLQQIVKDYPFFHNAHFLYLYGLHKTKPEKFNEQLKSSALFLSSRKELYKAVKFGIQETTEKSQPVNLSKTIEKEALNTVAKDEAIQAIVPERTIAVVPLIETVKKETSITDDEPSREITFDESTSFSLEESQPIEVENRKEEDNAVEAEPSTGLLEFDMADEEAEPEPTPDLIDQFLKVNPRIVPRLDLEDTRGDISEPCLLETDEIVTETLAMILEQQGHYQKAKEAYQKLILKYPEKSTYFASQIEELNKRIK
jgi:hypothetical protein